MAVVLMAASAPSTAATPVKELLNAQGQVLPYSNAQALGRLMYTDYLFPIEVAAGGHPAGGHDRCDHLEHFASARMPRRLIFSAQINARAQARF